MLIVLKTINISLMIIFDKPLEQATKTKTRTCLKTTETPEAKPFYPKLE